MVTFWVVPSTQSIRSVKGLDMYSKFYERYKLIGDFNAEESEPRLSQFLFEMNAKNIVKEPTCYKSLSNPSCIDLVIYS